MYNDKDGLTVKGNAITGLATGASLRVNTAGTYNVNGVDVTANAGEVLGADATGGYNYAQIEPEIEETVDAGAVVETLVDTTTYDPVEASAITEEGADLNGNLSVSLTNTATGGDAQTVNFSNSTGSKSVSLSGGAQDVTFNNEGGNVAVVDADSKGDKNITLGNGGDVAIVDASKSTSITTGTGNDTLVVRNGAEVSVDVSAGGATNITATGTSKVNLTGYNAEESNAGINTGVSNIANAVESGTINFGNGEVSVKSATVNVNAEAESEGATVVNLYNNKGVMTKVASTNSDGGTADMSNQKAATVMKGNYKNSSATADKGGESSLLGGSGNDSIFAGASDVIDAGAGTNTIKLTDASKRGTNAESGATIAMTSEKGRNEVTGFNASFEDTGDKVAVEIDENLKISYSGSSLVIKSGRAQTKLNGLSAITSSGDVVSSADIGNVGYQQILIGSGEDALKTAVAQSGSVIRVGDDEESLASAYLGDNSGVDFTEVSSDVFVNLADNTGTVNDDSIILQGINKLAAGSGNATLMGSSANETLVAGTGANSIWGGAGKDVMRGSSSSDKDGATTFFFMGGDGKDSVTSFNFLTDENAETADVISTGGTAIGKISKSGNNVVMQLNGTTDRLTIVNGANNDIKINDSVYQVGSTLEYDGRATNYVADGKNASVSLSSELDNANVWLDADLGTSFGAKGEKFEGSIKSLNASAFEGEATLVGSSASNSITASKEGSSLWGGNGGDNTLVGGNGEDTFFYLNNGNKDTIQGASSDDVVNLFGVSLEDVDLINSSITTSGIKLKFSNGGTLTVNGNTGVGFMISDTGDTQWTVNQRTGEWTTK